MFSGWIHASELVAGRGGTEFVTISVPDDFYAVRIGFANAGRSPFMVSKVIACASAHWNDGINPLDQASVPRPPGAWARVTFANGGTGDPTLIDEPDAPDRVTVAAAISGLSPAGRLGHDPTNPVWTFTDWVPCVSAPADPATGMRILMLRALVPDGQIVTYTNGAMDGFTGQPDLHCGYRYFLGGMCHGHDRVNHPENTLSDKVTPEILVMNRIANGPIMCLIQVMTRHAGIVGLVAGDSHQAGTAANSQINNFLLRCLFPVGGTTKGKLPIGLVNTASGGLVSAQFFPRMTALLDAVRPGFVVLPGWSFNDTEAGIHATEAAENKVFARMLLAAEEVRRSGAIPIFLTPFPRDPAGMTEDVRLVWLARRQAILTLRESGEIVVDATLLLGARTGDELNGTYLEQFTIDQMHPNDAGHTAIANVLRPIVLKLAGLTEAEALSDRTPASA